MLAIAEANTGVALFLQWLIYRTLKTTRLATSYGADADSFGADFLFARYPSVSSTGQVVFSRFTSATQVIIPINTIVKTSDNANSFIVIPDSSNPAYNPVQLAFIMQVGITNLSVLVQAVIPGSIGNVAAGTITKLGSSLAVGGVNNPAPFVNGVDVESDASYKSRFQLYINSRYRATEAAIENAIVNTQTGLSYTIQENVDAAGKPLPGNVVIYVDDGTGFPPPLLITTLQTNVDEVRAASVSFSLEAANTIAVSIEMSTTWLNGYNPNNYKGAISTAVINYINSLKVGQSLYLTRLYQIIYDSTPGLQDAYGLLINGLPTDLIIKPSQVARFLVQIPLGSNLIVSEMTID